MSAVVPGHVREIVELRAEIERLRALLKEIHAWMDDEWEQEFKDKIARAIHPQSESRSR